MSDRKGKPEPQGQHKRSESDRQRQGPQRSGSVRRDNNTLQLAPPTLVPSREEFEMAEDRSSPMHIEQDSEAPPPPAFPPRGVSGRPGAFRTRGVAQDYDDEGTATTWTPVDHPSPVIADTADLAVLKAVLAPDADQMHRMIDEEASRRILDEAVVATTEPNVATEKKKWVFMAILVLIIILLATAGATLAFTLSGTSAPSSSTPTPTPTVQWMQLGQVIDATTIGDRFGSSVFLSANGMVLAVGAPYGHDRVFQLQGDIWVQVGSDLDSEVESDLFGSSISLSADGMTVAVGAPHNDANGARSGNVCIFQQNGGGQWVQVGNDLYGATAYDEFGFSVSLSADSLTIAIGAPYGIGNGVRSGYVQVYQLKGGEWVKVGADIVSKADYDAFDQLSVSLSSDGTTVAIGTPYNDAIGLDSGSVHVYQLTGDQWTQVGSVLSSGAAQDQFGRSVSLSADGMRVAIGAPYHYGNGSKLGQVRVYQLKGSEWIQVGSDINGMAAYDEFGASVSMSANGTTVAVGAPNNDKNAAETDSGHVRMYQLERGKWIQVGSDIHGKVSDHRFGHSVALSADGNTVAIVAPGNGRIRVYHLQEQ